MEETLSVLSDDVCERDDKSMGSSCLTVPSAPKRGMRKRSFDDAQSRLKSRKLLGLGGKEASKVLQVLGNCEHLDTKLPRGLSLWLFSSSLMFLAMAILCLFLVRPFSIWLGVDHAPRRNVLEVRLLGATFAGLFCLTFLTSVTSYLVVRNILLCHLVYFGQLV
ncbi:tumor protein p53-inducible protein 11-like [Xenia sp. Carnegie-2017]|uniref:tumor protein p53-inducible protein 11-like n=1 Tax=Xenia sp. Carnegie-2017 TaxID=2897299 RepID=UPI001F03F3F9|nr:tumor protein p53-inducible protein 11-like [Xenia sp. Carnegie-2017]